MKRIFLSLGAIMLFSITFFTSCSSDDPTPVTPPTISFVAGAGFISDDATLTVGSNFSVKILAEANTTSNSKLQSMKVTRVFNLQSSDTSYTFNETTLSVTISFVAQSAAGVERIEFKVTDKDGQSSTIDVQITTEEDIVPVPYQTFVMKVLGSYQSALGSSFASANGEVYSLAQAFANQAAIDFLYWWGASSSATLGAPDDPNANQVYTGVNGLPNWTTKNPTRFKTTAFTAAEFDAIDDGSVLITNATGADQTRLGSLAVGNVIAFMTASGKHGMIKVTSIITSASGEIEIDVKVEE